MAAPSVGDSAKSIDFILRSVVSGLLALVLVSTLCYSALTGHAVTGEVGAAVLTATGTVIGYFFGNHAAVNGSMLASMSARRDADENPPAQVITPQGTTTTITTNNCPDPAAPATVDHSEAMARLDPNSGV